MTQYVRIDGDTMTGPLYLHNETPVTDIEAASKAYVDSVISGGGLSLGNSVSGGSANRVLYVNASLDLADDADLTFDGSRLTVGSGAGYFATEDTHFISSHDITSIGTSASPFDLIKIGSETIAYFNPSADTNSGIGLTIYAANGIGGFLIGNKNFNGGLALGSGVDLFSALGTFATVNDNRTGGTIDGLGGILFSAAHSGFGANTTLMIGGIFDANTTDDAGNGSVSGSVTTAAGGLFICGASGVGITNAYAAIFREPRAFDQATGVGVPTITNKTAIRLEGTISTKRVDTASTATENAFDVQSSSHKLTGTTAETLNGIADGFDGKEFTLYNGTNQTLTINHENGSASADDRIITPTGAAVTVAAGYHAIFWYDSSQSRWILQL